MAVASGRRIAAAGAGPVGGPWPAGSIGDEVAKKLRDSHRDALDRHRTVRGSFAADSPVDELVINATLALALYPLPAELAELLGETANLEEEKRYQHHLSPVNRPIYWAVLEMVNSVAATRGRSCTPIGDMGPLPRPGLGPTGGEAADVWLPADAHRRILRSMCERINAFSARAGRPVRSGVTPGGVLFADYAAPSC